jgi:hypothetical protein
LRLRTLLKQVSDARLKLFNAGINILYWLFAAPVVMTLLLLCLPVVGNFFAVMLAGLAGCELSVDRAVPCLVFGKDMSEIFLGYSLSILLLRFGNPFMLMRGAWVLSTAFEAWMFALSVYSVIVVRRAVRFEALRRFGQRIKGHAIDK